MPDTFASESVPLAPVVELARSSVRVVLSSSSLKLPKMPSAFFSFLAFGGGTVPDTFASESVPLAPVVELARSSVSVVLSSSSLKLPKMPSAFLRFLAALGGGTDHPHR